MGWILLGVLIVGWFFTIVLAARMDTAPVEPDPVGYALIFGWLWPALLVVWLIVGAATWVAKRF